jgi:hypothetical protein
VRTALVAALVACADVPLRSRARRFLVGLSSDELQFIAEFLGACILECGSLVGNSREQLACRIAEFQQSRAASARCASDEEHKMILLLEFLTRKGQKQNLEVRS